MEYNVRISGSPSAVKSFAISGDNVIDALKSSFDQTIRKSAFHHIPFRYPITVTPSFVVTSPAGTIRISPDGKTKNVTTEDEGYIAFKLEWKYSNGITNEEVHTHIVEVAGTRDMLTDTTPFVVLGN